MNPTTAKLVEQAARWHPAGERQDYIDENLDVLGGFVADGRSLTALRIAAFDYARAALTLGVPAWVRHSNAELVGAWIVGALYFALIVIADSGLAFISLSFGAMLGAPICLSVGFVFGRRQGIVTPSGRRFDRVAYSVSMSIVLWAIASLTAGLVGWTFGLAGFVVAVAPAVLRRKNASASIVADR